MNGQPTALAGSNDRTLLMAAALLGGLFAAVQPDATATPWLRLALQWQLQCVLPMLFLIGARRAAAYALPQLSPNGWSVLIGSGAVAVSAFTPIALWLDIALGGEATPANWWPALLDEFGGFAPPAMASWLALNVVTRRRKTDSALPSEPERETSIEPTIEPAAVASGLQAALPAEIRGIPTTLKAELQYLNVTTETGTALVLYSLRNAIDELSDIAGIQPHRSYWVRLDTIAGFERDGRQGRLRLANGMDIPVSRSRVASVKAALARENRN